MSEYVFKRITKTDGSESHNLSLTQPTESIFQIPRNEFINFSKSMLQFVYVPLAQGAGRVNRVYASCFPFIQRIEMYTSDMKYLACIDNLTKYTRVVWPAETKLKDFLKMSGEYSSKYGVFDLNDTNPVLYYYPKSGSTCMLQKIISNSQTAVVYDVYDPTVYPINYVNLPTNPLPINQVFYRKYMMLDHYDAIRPHAQGFSNNDWFGIPGTEQQYYIMGNPNYNTDTPEISIDLPLNMLYNSFFSKNEDLYVNENIYIKLVWNPENKIMYSGTSYITPATGALAPTVAGGITILSLSLATVGSEQDKKQKYEKLIKEGQTMNVYFPISYVKNIANTATSKNLISINLDSSLGNKLIKIYNSVFIGNNPVARKYDNSNYQGVYITSYTTKLDEKQLQGGIVECGRDDDYLVNKFHLDKSMITSNVIHKTNWFHLDKFKDLSLQRIERPLKYEFDATCVLTNAEYNTFVITEKTVTINPGDLKISVK